MRANLLMFSCCRKKKSRHERKMIRKKQSLPSCTGPFQRHPMRWYLHVVGRKSHSNFSWRSNDLLGNSFSQNRHSFGNSETAFSTAKFLEAVDLEISTRQLGQVAIWSRNLRKEQENKSHLFGMNGLPARTRIPSIGKQMREARCAHQMPHLTLQRKRKREDRSLARW